MAKTIYISAVDQRCAALLVETAEKWGMTDKLTPAIHAMAEAKPAPPKSSEDTSTTPGTSGYFHPRDTRRAEALTLARDYYLAHDSADVPTALETAVKMGRFIVALFNLTDAEIEGAS